MVDINAIMRLMDYDVMRELELRLLTIEALETNYGPPAEPRRGPVDLTRARAVRATLLDVVHGPQQ